MGADLAVPLLQQMRSAGIKPDLATYSKLLDVCAHAASHRMAQIDDVGDIFAQLSLDGLSPNTKTMNAMLKVCARLAAHGGACILDGFEMFQWCLDSGMVLKSPSFVAPVGVAVPPVPHSLHHADPSTELTRSKVSFEAMAEALSLLDGRIIPDVITYNTLVEICAKSAMHGSADLQDGLQVVDLMRSQVGFFPPFAWSGPRLAVVALPVGSACGVLKLLICDLPMRMCMYVCT